MTQPKRGERVDLDMLEWLIANVESGHMPFGALVEPLRGAIAELRERRWNKKYDEE